MIPVTELRIGNWVLVDGVPDTVLAIRFYDSSMQPYRVEVERTRSRLAKDLHSITPIPLTQEILEKCGFEKETMGDGFDQYSLQGVAIDMPYFTHSYNYGDYEIEVKYLHQLQNLYHALTSTELEIKL